MKALFLCQNLNVGGAEELILGASTTLPAIGVETGVVALTRRGPIADEIEAAGVPVHLVTGEPGPRDPAAFIRMVRLLQRERPDVVHTFLIVAGIYGRLAAFAAGVPLVLAAEQNVYARKPRRHALMERALASRTYRVVACCDVVGRFYQQQVGIPRSKIEVIYNAVRFGPRPRPTDTETARFALRLPPDALVLGTLGRLTAQKGQRILLQAIATLSRDLPDLVLFLAGAGPLREALEAEAARLGLADRVRFLGVRRDRATLYAAMDVFVLPSRWEGLSLALVEAMGAGRAIVATNVGGNPEVVHDGQTGLLVPPDDPTALAGALGKLARDRALRTSLGDAAAVDARARFSIDQHVAQLSALYRQGLARQLPRPDLSGARR
ncbi:MAG TPA: glycosyltransferase [Chloroflexota bacterium]|nr:glycosyltransferase [Chloroflexota bacterium]